MPPVQEVLLGACHEKILGSQPITVPVVPGPDCKPNACFENVKKQVEELSGEAQYGWTFSRSERMLAIAHHVVWRNPDGVLIDITPAPAPPKGVANILAPLLTEDGKRFFLLDNAATLIPGPKYSYGRPKKFYALTNNANLKKDVRKMNVAEYAYGQALKNEDWKQADKLYEETTAWMNKR